VEDEEQHAFLKENACDEVQGYFGKPMAVEDFTAWLTRQAGTAGNGQANNCPQAQQAASTEIFVLHSAQYF
jgi:hypothetical protein